MDLGHEGWRQWVTGAVGLWEVEDGRVGNQWVDHLFPVTHGPLRVRLPADLSDRVSRRVRFVSIVPYRSHETRKWHEKKNDATLLFSVLNSRC